MYRIWLSCVIFISTAAQAHLMVAQHGSLNLVNNDAFMVLSLPVAAFEGIDNDKDGQVSMIEFNLNRKAIIGQIKQRLSLGDTKGDFPLEGVILSPVMAHHSTEQEVSQITVLGKFLVGNAASELTFSVNLFGASQAEKVLNMTVTRPADNWQYEFTLTPDSPKKTWGKESH